MAFERTELSLMAYTGTVEGNHFYFYANTAEDDVTAANFFDEEAESISNGDLLYDSSTGGQYRLTVAEGVVTATQLVAPPA